MVIRFLQYDDYFKGYMELMYQLSHYEHNITPDQFKMYLDNNKNIIKVLEHDNKIIGAGSLFVMDKLHCNPYAQIEDVVIDKNYRRQGLGKKIIQDLVETGRPYYKIVLNCIDENVDFYISCGFTKSGSQMKYIV